jgi:ABC-2 type transport system ATP-binding protein
MSDWAVEVEGVDKAFRFFQLHDISLKLAPGQILGLVGPNGAGKSTTLRILLALLQQDRGSVKVLGHAMPDQQALAKRYVGYVSEDMRLYANTTLGWHLNFVASIYPEWDATYAGALLHRFNLKPQQPIRSLSHGERAKAALLLALARRPRLLVLDEPTTGFDPVARHEVLAEFMEVVGNEERAVIFSSQNTQDVEQISDQIVFIDRGRIIDARDKESFVDQWRRLHLELAPGVVLPSVRSAVDVQLSGHIAIVTTNAYTRELPALYASAGAVVREVQRMTLEEIFVANVMRSRRERAA